MLEKDQATAAANAVLRDALKEQEKRTVKIAKRRGKWKGIGAVAGLGIGSLISYLVVGHMLPWGILGIVFGVAIGGLIDQRASAFNISGGA